MKIIAPLLVAFALLQYTAPSGHPIFIVREQIVAIAEAASCAASSGARVVTSSGSLCVRESIEQAVDKYLVEPAK